MNSYNINYQLNLRVIPTTLKIQKTRLNYFINCLEIKL